MVAPATLNAEVPSANGRDIYSPDSSWLWDECSFHNVMRALCWKLACHLVNFGFNHQQDRRKGGKLPDGSAAKQSQHLPGAVIRPARSIF